MEITFTKGNGKYDRMTVPRGDRAETIDCPKQRIIPHDMVHYAVESTLHKRGFLSRVRDGEAASFQMVGESESDAVERLVEVMQGDAWSGSESAPADMLELYRVTCNARRCPTLPITNEDVLALRRCITELDQQWQELPVGQILTVQL